MSIEAMKQALEALQEITGVRLTFRQSEAITALRQAIEQAELAKPEQEPVAYVEKGDLYWCDDVSVYDADKLDGLTLYTAPPRKEWQAVNGKLEVEPIKGALLPQAEKQEHQFKYTPYGLRADESGNLSIGELLRKEWVGLTDEEIFEITERHTKEGGICNGWCVAVEVQQKIKEKNT